MQGVRAVAAVLLLLFGVVLTAIADEATTIGNPDIPVDELELRLRPLTREQLQTEAAAWQALLQQRVSDVSKAEIASRLKKAGLASTDKVKDAIEAYEEAGKAAKEKPDDEDAQAAVKEARDELDQVLTEAKARYQQTRQDKEVEAVAREAETAVEEESGKSAGPAGASANNIDTLKQRIERFEQREADTRAELLTRLTELRAAQTATNDRFSVVLTAYQLKGGDSDQIEEYRQYVRAVSGIKVDVSDTQAVWATLTGWLTSDEGGLRWAKNVALFIATLLFFIVLSSMATRALAKLFARSRQMSQLLSDFMVVTVRRLILAVGVLVGLAAMEVNVGPVLAVVGAAGFVIAFALQNSLGNFASGILILVFRPFDVGDVIEVAGVLGTVQSMNLLSIQIRTPDNKSVIIANNQIWDGVITNVTGTSTRRVDLVFGIAYSDDIAHAQRVLQEVVEKHEKILKDPEPIIRVHELGDSSVNFICRPWVRTVDYWDVYWDLTEQAKQRFDEEGISIPFPQRDVHMIAPPAETTA